MLEEICLTIIAICCLMNTMLGLVKFHKVFGEEEEEEMPEDVKRMFS
jgi:hypothetical protein